MRKTLFLISVITGLLLASISSTAPSLSAETQHAIQISAGSNHTCAVIEDGSVQCWGYSGFGATSVPQDLGLVTQVVAAYDYSCALTKAQTVRCWSQQYEFAPTSPFVLSSVSAISAGEGYTCSVQGFVLCWGNRFYGTPEIPADLGLVKEIGVGSNHACALTVTEYIRCWNNNRQGATANNYGQSSIPPNLGKLHEISVGWDHTCVITQTGETECWGNDEFGQIDVPADLEQSSQISVGAFHTCAISVAGKTRCWGSNEFGQTNVPTDLGLTFQISSGRFHTCAITVTGATKCWGRNEAKQTNVPSALSVERQFKTSSIPSISGSFSVGSQLTANPGNWDAGSTFRYQWLRDSVEISGATSNNYLITPSDYRHKLSVRLLASHIGYPNATLSSAEKPVGLGKKAIGSIPSILGSLKSGQTVSVKVSNWLPNPKLSYQWTLEGKEIKNATAARLKISPSYKGKKLAVRVTQESLGYEKLSGLSASRKIG